MLDLSGSFVNRTAELAFLAQAFEAETAQLLVLHGRRRIGKTWLLQHFLDISRKWP